MAKLNLTDEQKELLRAAYRRAQAIPEGLDMDEWIEASSKTPCGTAGCYAYEICVASGQNPQRLYEKFTSNNRFSIAEEAARILNLPAGALKWSLFSTMFWPADLKVKYRRVSGDKERADVLAEVAERFIAAGGDKSSELWMQPRSIL